MMIVGYLNFINERLEKKWNKGIYDYQSGYCHYFAYNIKDKIKKRFTDKDVKYYLLMALEEDIESGAIITEYLVHVYIKIGNFLLDSNGIIDIDKADDRLDDWEKNVNKDIPDIYKVKTWTEESDDIPDIFFNNFCNIERVRKDLEDFMNNPIVKRILRDK